MFRAITVLIVVLRVEIVFVLKPFNLPITYFLYTENSWDFPTTCTFV